MRHKNFACFILTHGRPHSQKTYKFLRRIGYTGDIYLIIDDEDDSADEYKKIYGKEVIQFCKEEAAKKTDRGDNIQKRNTVLFARNVVHDIASSLGLQYFLMLDDDYITFAHRWIENGQLKSVYPYFIEDVFDVYLDFLERTPCLSVCLMQAGDLIGGASDFMSIACKRKAMNSFFCMTSRPYKFVGRMNDDVNTYVTLGSRGELFLSFHNVIVRQEDTQRFSGGLTEMYLEYGTYMKSFYTVMMCPSAVKIGVLRDKFFRFHHKINWNNCVPKILPSRCRKVMI